LPHRKATRRASDEPTLNPRAVFNGRVAEGGEPDRPDPVQSFTDAQRRMLLAVARKTFHSRRDEAIVLLLLDTGPRASEPCRRRNAGHVRPNDYSSW
jgi:integrase